MYHSPQSFVPDFDWKDFGEHGDVVLFALPINEGAESPADKPKRRPCFEVDVFERNCTSCAAITLKSKGGLVCPPTPAHHL